MLRTAPRPAVPALNGGNLGFARCFLENLGFPQPQPETPKRALERTLKGALKGNMKGFGAHGFTVWSNTGDPRPSSLNPEAPP